MLKSVDQSERNHKILSFKEPTSQTGDVFTQEHSNYDSTVTITCDSFNGWQLIYESSNTAVVVQPVLDSRDDTTIWSEPRGNSGSADEELNQAEEVILLWSYIWKQAASPESLLKRNFY